MASAAVVNKNRLHSPVVRSILRQTRRPLGAGKLFVEIVEARERQIHLLLRSVREGCFPFGGLEANRLRPNLVLPAFRRGEKISSRVLRVHSGCTSIRIGAGRNANSLKRLAV